MKRKRFSIEHIVAVLKQAELGTPVADLIRKVWKKQYKGLDRNKCENSKNSKRRTRGSNGLSLISPWTR